MKRKVNLMLICLSLSTLTFAQSQEQQEKSSSKTVEFLAKDGTFFKKEFYDLPTVGSSYSKVDCQVLIITDMKTNEKRGCLRLTTYYSSSVSNDDYIGTLDPDELDACIICLDKIQTDIATTTPETYTEAEYKTRDGVHIGTYWNDRKKEWVIYVQTKNYTTRSLSQVSSANVPVLIQNLKNAKQMIADKTK